VILSFSQNEFVFRNIGDGNYALPLSNDWRYTIQSIPIVNRVVTINNNQYKFGQKLGTGGFGSVYAALRLPNSNTFFSLFYHISISIECR
jgi:serine/threonine protein kinase